MHGDVITIPLTHGKVAIIDVDDAPIVSGYRWHAIKRGGNWYAQAYAGGGRANNVSIYLHRLIMDPPKGIAVDHVDRDGLNCRRSNMRWASWSQNLCNRGPQANNTSGYKGVTWDRSRQLWAARIKMDNRMTYIGRFADPQEAAQAYDAVAREAFGDFAWLNFPDEHSEVS